MLKWVLVNGELRSQENGLSGLSYLFGLSC